MKVYYIFFAVILLSYIKVDAQSIQNQIISGSGSNMTNGTNSIVWTLGEPLTASYKNGVTLSIGFHQELFTGPSAVGGEAWSHQVTVYPNPTHDQINVDFTGEQGKVQMQLLRIDGTKILSSTLPDLHNSYDLGHLPAGLYLIHLIKEKSTITYKVVKSKS